jgi:hypothetical protein
MFTWWNIGGHFLRIYHLIFRRISLGSSRLQEVLADRMAAIHYGARSFEEGLRHVIRRSLEFDAVADAELTHAVETHRALQNLYTLPPADPQAIEDAYDKVLATATSEDDSHPSPADRFRLVGKLADTREISERALVWDLFADPQGIQAKMLDRLNQQVKLLSDALAAQEAAEGGAVAESPEPQPTEAGETDREAVGEERK